MLGKSNICVEVGASSSAWTDTELLYTKSAGHFEAYDTDDFLGWYHPGRSGVLPYGFEGMDLCWVFRILQSVDPASLTLVSPNWDVYPDPRLVESSAA